MKLYRDFENDPVRFSYSEGEKFLDKIHQSGRHWIPIVDAAIWDSNPENGSDVYV
jgi:alpha-glucosidase